MNFLKNQKKILLFFVIILLLLANILLGYTLLQNDDISIKNNSNEYLLTYHETDEFIQVIMKMKIFSDGIIVNGKKALIQQIIIELTDKPQHQQFIINEKNVTLYSAESELIKGGKLLIRLNINPSLSSTNQEELQKNILQLTIRTLYKSIYPASSIKQLNKELPIFLQPFSKDPQKNPFEVRPR